MRKLYLIILSTLVLSGCLSLKYTNSDFEGQIYICDLGRMVGRSIIKFDKNTFIYSERDSLFIGEGKWALSEDKKKLILIGKISNKDKIPEVTINKVLKLELMIKGKNKLVGNDMVFVRKGLTNR
jgi:hypothetical protein